MVEVEHLKLIQAIIDRLGGNSFLLKGWTVTLVTALAALARAGTDRSFAWIAVFVVVAFGLLDAYYLALERAYRDLYKRAIAGRTSDWDLSIPSVGAAEVAGALTSFSVWTLHGMVLALAVAVALTT